VYLCVCACVCVGGRIFLSAPLLQPLRLACCLESGVSPQWSWPGEEGTVDDGPEGSREGAWECAGEMMRVYPHMQ